MHSHEQSAVFGVGNREIVENDKYQNSGTGKKNVVETQRKLSFLLNLAPFFNGICSH